MDAAALALICLGVSAALGLVAIVLVVGGARKEKERQ